MLKSLGGGAGSVSNGQLVGFRVLTGSGTYIPSSGAKALLVFSIGAGGGSGGLAAQTSVFCATGGGGAGALARSYVTPLAASYAYSCGIGGIGGVAGNNAGANGGITTFGAEATASGGDGSPGVDAASFPAIIGGGLGGSTGGAGQYKMGGMAGGPAIALTGVAASGAGGSTPYGTGGPSRSGLTSGVNATGFGGGAGGANSGGGGTSRAGGNGSDGAVLVWEYA